MPSAPTSGSASGFRRIVGIIVLAAVALFLLAAQIAWVGPARVAATLREADPLLLSLALAAIVVGALSSAANAWWLAARDEGIGFHRFLPHYWTGWAVGLLLPGQVGDALTLSLLLRQHRVPMQRSLAGLGVDKLVSLLVSLAAACALPLVFADGSDSLLATALLACTLLALAGVAAADRWLAAAAERASHPGMRYLCGALAHAAGLVRRRPLLVCANLAVSITKLALTGLAYALALRAVGAEVQPTVWVAITLCATAAGLVAYLPLSLNGIGTVELTGLALFGALGLPAAQVLSAYLCLRLLTLSAALAPLGLLLALSRRRANSAGG